MTITFSKATKNAIFFGSEILRVKIKPSTSSKNFGADGGGAIYIAEFFSKTQAFHKKMSENEVEEFFKANAGTTFKNAANDETASSHFSTGDNPNPSNSKNYILKEGFPIPFLVQLGIMTEDGRVIKSKYDKFRQINRFLEFIDDVVPEITRSAENALLSDVSPPDVSSSDDAAKNVPIKIIDFGCGKSYLTFAIHYFFTEILKIETEIIGLDLKKDVIEYCKRLAEKIGAKNLHFQVGDIKEFAKKASPINFEGKSNFDAGNNFDTGNITDAGNNRDNRLNLVVTLHACDTATDAALDFAVGRKADVILSVPCCQHELNAKITKMRGTLSGGDRTSPLEPILKYGILRERFSAIATDAFRCEYLEENGYKTQIMEFIDIEHTPKNLLIRAVRKTGETAKAANEKARTEAARLQKLLGSGIYGRNYD